MSDETKVWISPDGCVRKTISMPGIWGETPRDGSKCLVSLEQVVIMEGFPNTPEQEESLKNSLYFSPSLSNIPETVFMGEADSDLDRILETCIRTMVPKEECNATLLFRSREQDREDPESPQKNPVPAINLRIKLLDSENVTPYYLLPDEKKYVEVVRHKAAGVELFAQGRTIDAFLRFSKAVKLLIYMVVDSDETEAKICKLRGALYANMASCQLKRENYSRAEELCTRALALEEANVKILYRRGIARTHLQEYELACEDLEKARNLEPKNEAVKKALLEVKKKTKELNAVYGAAVKKAFNLW